MLPLGMMAHGDLIARAPRPLAPLAVVARSVAELWSPARGEEIFNLQII